MPYYALTICWEWAFCCVAGDDIIDSDVPCLKRIGVYEDCPGTILGVQEVPQDKVCSYGIVKPLAMKDNLWQAVDLVEKPVITEAPSRLAVLGRYILQPEILIFWNILLLAGAKYSLPMLCER